MRFISLGGGLCDLALGRISVDEFEKNFLGEWYTSVGRRRIDRDIDRAIVDPALARLRRQSERDPWAAGRAFAHAVLDPFAERAGARGWVEMTPGNALRAKHLARMFPGMRLVHTYRDGRDVAASVVPLHWGPTDVDEGLDWWAERLERAFKSSAAVSPQRVHHLQIEDLVLRDRDEAYRRLLEFVGFASPEMRVFFNERMTEANAHLGRWLRDVPPDRREAFEAHHDRLAADLTGRGRPYVPLTADEGKRPQPVAAGA